MEPDLDTKLDALCLQLVGIVRASSNRNVDVKCVIGAKYLVLTELTVDNFFHLDQVTVQALLAACRQRFPRVEVVEAESSMNTLKLRCHYSVGHLPRFSTLLCKLVIQLLILAVLGSILKDGFDTYNFY